MQNKNDWFAQFPPLQLKEETQMAEQVEKRVLRRIAESSQPQKVSTPMKRNPNSAAFVRSSLPQPLLLSAQSPW
ncbi:MAG: hypothetical protein ACLR5S_08725 [Ruminococcus sp.]